MTSTPDHDGHTSGREWFCYAASVGHPTSDCTPDEPHNPNYCGWADEGYGNSATAVAARRPTPSGGPETDFPEGYTLVPNDHLAALGSHDRTGADHLVEALWHADRADRLQDEVDRLRAEVAALRATDGDERDLRERVEG